MENNNIESQFLFQNIGLPEALSHLLHSRSFEILGYLSIIKKEENSEELIILLNRVEEITKKLLNEFHSYLEHYKENNNVHLNI